MKLQKTIRRMHVGGLMAVLALLLGLLPAAVSAQVSAIGG